MFMRKISVIGAGNVGATIANDLMIEGVASEIVLVDINAKRAEISRYIGPGGVSVKVNTGRIWIMRGTPFSSTMGDPEDDLIKRMLLNVSVTFFLTD
jgi:hypothetical protein